MLGQNYNIRIGGPLTPVVKKLLIINGTIFLIFQIFGSFYPQFTMYLENLLGLSHIGFIQEFKLWQIFTYMFLHAGWLHIIMNLLVFWMFAGELEQIWGSKSFLNFYIFSGVGAGFFIIILNYLIYLKYHINPVTIGASGAIYAVLAAYGISWPDRKVIIFPLFIPIKIKYMVILFGCISFFGTLASAAGTGGQISHIGHFGGIISGLLYMFLKLRKSNKPKIVQKNDNIISRVIRKAKISRKKKVIETRIEAKKIIDELLEKIARNGMSSLSAKEKKDLEWARKHYFPDHNDTVH